VESSREPLRRLGAQRLQSLPGGVSSDRRRRSRRRTMACAFVEQVLRNSIRDASPLRNSAMVVASEVHSPSRGSLHQPQYLQGDTDGRGRRRRQARAQAAAMGGARYGSGGASRADAAWLGRWRRSGGADREGGGQTRQDGRQAGRVPLSCLARRRAVEGGGLVGRGVR
jgi:hypothetical protein